MAEFIYNLNFVGVPSDFIENIMPKANGAFVKVYLYAINLAAKGRKCNYGSIADALDLLESDVIKAFDFLAENGCLFNDGDKIVFGEYAASTEAEVSEQINKSESYTPDENRRIKIEHEFTSNKKLAELCKVAQEMLGRTLSDSDLATLYWFYDELGFTPEVITMLLEYCISIDKRNMKYIEKVAIGWHENGINNMDSAEKYMQEQKERSSYIYRLRKLFGIDNRSLAKTEELFLKKWHDEYKMSEEMIALAYEYSIMQISKLSFPYMNSIIERWNNDNIRTVADAEKDQEEFKSGASAASDEKDLGVYKDDSGFDYGKVEEIMRKKYDN